MFPGGSNILRNTNVSVELTSGTWATGAWRNGGSGIGSRESIVVTDAPNPDIVQGWRILNTGENTHEVSVAQSSVPLIIGREYTVSCYVRAVSGTISFKLQHGIDGYYVSKAVVITQTDWQKASFTFTAAASIGSFYFISRAVSTGAVEICGMKLESGNKATDWSLSPWDMVSRVDFNALADRVAILESR